MLVIEAKRGLNLTKIHGPEGTKGYDEAREFKMTRMGIRSFESMCKLLKVLEDEPSKCVLRGDADVIEPGFTNLRRYKVNGGALEMVPTQWLLFDWDGTGSEWESWVQEGLKDPAGTIEKFLSSEHVPPELEAADVYWQYGSSFGVKLDKFSVHLWVWLDREVLDPSAYYKKHGFDAQLALGTQPHYTARPLFKDGTDDPMPVRSGVRLGSGPMDAGGVVACQPTEVLCGGAGEVMVMADKTEGELRDELDALEASEGERHEVVRNWSLQAVTNGMEATVVAELAEGKLLELGKDARTARVDSANMAKGAVRMVERGRVVVDSPERVFTDVVERELSDEGGAVNEQRNELCGPTVAETVKADGLRGLLSCVGKLKAMSEVELYDLEELLWDEGILVASKPARGQITPAKLKALRSKGRGDEGGTVDEAVVKAYRERYERVYCSSDLKTYYLYDPVGRKCDPISKGDQLDMMCRYMSAPMSKEDAMVFREKFYDVIHRERCIEQWVSVTKPDGVSETRFSVRDDGKLDAVVEVSMLRELEVLRGRWSGVDVPDEFVEWMDREYGVVWDIMKALLARRFLGDKRSTVWLNCPSNWGKSFFFNVEGLAMAVENSYKAEDFRGNDAATMGKYLYVYVDEADRFTKEMKLDKLSYRKLYGGHTEVVLPAKLLASANTIGDLADGVDAQLLNRIVKISVDGEGFEARLRDVGWTPQRVRPWYVKVLVEKLWGWLAEWNESGDCLGVMDDFYKGFCESHRISGVENLEETVRFDFWNHYLWEVVLKTSRGGYCFKPDVDDRYFYLDVEAERLYVKRTSTWFKRYIETTFGDKIHAIRRSFGDVESIVRYLNVVEVQKLRDQTPFRGFYVDLTKAKCLETTVIREVK